MTVLAQEELRQVPVAKIKAWSGNPRKVFPSESMFDLCESIKVKGILVPLLLRPDGPSGYEIADGERRWRAAVQAGLKVVPAVVRELSDKEMLEISLVSEGQREDLSPLDRADGIKQLVALLDGKVEEAAARLGKSASSVRAALRLRQLPSEASDALADGRLSLSVAELIAARPSEEMRAKVAEYALGEQLRWHRGHQVRERPSYRDLKEWIAQECMVELKQAPFDPKEAGLTGAGACTSCPKRSGNNRDEYPEGRADLCTDPPCFRLKVQAWQARLTAEATAQGQTILSAEEAARVFPHHSHLGYNSPYFDFKDQCHEDRTKKTPRSYKQLLEPHLQAADVILCLDPSNELHRLVRRGVALPILQKEHGLFKGAAAGSAGGKSLEDAREEAKRRQEGAVARLADVKLLAAAAAQGERWGNTVHVWTDPTVDLLAAVAARLARTVDHERSALLCKRRGLKVSTRFENEQALDAAAQDLTGPQLVGLLAELLAAASVLGYSPMNNAKEIAALLKLDRKAAEKEARDELAQKQKGKSAAHGKDQGGGKKVLTLPPPAAAPVPVNGKPRKPRRAKAAAAK